MRGIILISVSLAIYFIPSFIAMYRNKVNYFKIFVINATLGWTIIAWIYCLIDSLRNDPIAVDVDEMARMAKEGSREVVVDLKTGNLKVVQKGEMEDGLSGESKISGGPKQSS